MRCFVTGIENLFFAKVFLMTFEKSKKNTKIEIVLLKSHRYIMDVCYRVYVAGVC